MKFTIFYNTGHSEIIEGTTIANAKLKHKIYAKAEASILMYQDGDVRNKYKWNKDSETWRARLGMKMVLNELDIKLNNHNNNR